MPEPDWSNNCADLAALRYRQAKRKSLWKQLGGRPRSAREAAALYRRLGVTNLKDAVSKVLGEPKSHLLARRGDIVMVDNALGICRGDLVECFDRMQPLARATCCWWIGKGNGG